MIRLSQPVFSSGTAEKLSRSLKSGYLTQGTMVSMFEAGLSRYLGVDESVVVSSGTAALHLALLASGLEADSEIIVPAFTFPATVNVVSLCGLIPVLTDISLMDYNLDTALLGEKLTPKTRAVMVVHEFGQPADLSFIRSFCQEHQLLLIEDAACAIGASYQNIRIGAAGSITCFSFHPRKCLTTGEGGAITSPDKSLMNMIRTLRSHGFDYSGAKPRLRAPGLNYRMTELQALLGLDQLESLDHRLEIRNHQAAIYQYILSRNSDLLLPGERPETSRTFQTYHLLLPAGISREKLISGMKESGIETNRGAWAIHKLDCYKQGADTRPFPCSEIADELGLALPIGEHLVDREVEFVARELLTQLSRAEHYE